MDIEQLVKQITAEVVQTLDSKCPIKEKCGNCSGEMLCVTEKTADVENLIHIGAARIGAGLGVRNVRPNIASLIDHTLLKPDSTPAEIQKLCEEASQYRFASVCVHPSYVGLCAHLLSGTSVAVCTVVGFPLGATTSTVKAYETQAAQSEGATEIDMVIHIGALKSQGYDYVEDDIRAVVQAANPGTIVKVIIETALLDDEQKVIACQLAKKAGAHFVKTSTGFGPGGAKASDIALMRRIVGDSMGVKASGGVRDRQAAELMIQAGASRIGASASVKIVS